MPIQVRSKDIIQLKKGYVRQNWSVVTLYNLTRLVRQKTQGRTFYQQKFAAKQETRKYHGEHLTKRQWQNIFKRSLKSVVSMNTRALADSDGSEFGAGRGSGLSTVGGVAEKKRSPQPVPYMNQTYAPMERRLDMAIFRAMFASSALQARQFVIHGFVKVNGKKMPYPQYMLNPGDMFSVDIEKILFATGAPKGLPLSQNPKHINRKKKGKEGEDEAKAAPGDAKSEAETVIEDPKTEAGAMAENAKPKKKTSSTPAAASDATDAAAAGEAEEVTEEKGREKKFKQNSVEWWLDENRPRVFDPLKPYRTPWRPRYYLSAFAFIPKYLEVSHSIGHAVYLRHPVAKAGQSEVPTPFHQETMQLAHNWFLRRR